MGVADLLPLPASAVTCGRRLDLPRKQRRHWWEPLGRDVRNKFDKGYVEVEVSVCSRCGKDKDEPA